MNSTDLADSKLAIALAEEAGNLLMAVRNSAVLSGKSLGAAGDAIANAFITRVLAQSRPEDGFLSEETAPDPARLNKERVWIIDPLDGTREFGEVSDDRTDWAVHVALAVNGRPVTAAVALPALNTVMGTAQAHRLPPMADGRLKILVSRTRAPDIAVQVARQLDAELIPMGSAGAKAMAVLRGDAHAYLHAGGQYEWDSCAPVGVALAAGLHASRIDGSPCVYNRSAVSMPDLLICRPEVSGLLLSTINAIGAGR